MFCCAKYELQAATCNLTGTCPPADMMAYHETLKLEGWWGDLFGDVVGFGEEVWGGTKEVCSSIGWDGCWSVVQGVVGWL